MHAGTSWIGQHPVHGGQAVWSDRRDGAGQYHLLGIAASTFLNGESEVRLRVSNADRFWVDTNCNFNSTVYLQGAINLQWASYGGGWYMQDTSWVRSVNNVGIYTGGAGQFDASLTTSGNCSVGAGMYCNGIMNYGGSTFNGDCTFACNNIYTGYISTRNGYRITSSGSYNGAWQNAGYINQGNTGGEQRTNSSFHTAGIYVAQIGVTTGGGLAAWNGDAGGYEGMTAYLHDVSSRKFKRDIKPWPAKSVGAGAMGAASRLSLIDVVEYRMKALPQNPIESGGVELHDCDVHDCDGTSDAPCGRMLDWENPRIGVIIEDLAAVLPEAVALTPSGFDGIRIGTMIGYLLAVCKEQQEHIEALEHHLEAA